MEALTPASAGDLPPLGEMIVNDPFWRHPSGTRPGKASHLRAWTTLTIPPGHLGRHVADAGFGGQPLVSQILMTACTDDLSVSMRRCGWTGLGTPSTRAASDPKR
jgi:hypothetical protein